MIADARRESVPAKRAPNNPRFERTKTAAELHPVIHVIDLSADGIAEVHMLGRKSKETTQASDIAHVERAEIEWNEKHFVRIDDERIGFAPARADPFAFG
jgi:hypothetical protein